MCGKMHKLWGDVLAYHMHGHTGMYEEGGMQVNLGL